MKMTTRCLLLMWTVLNSALSITVPAGFHCQCSLTRPECTTESCVPCYFPSNCLSNNTCSTGTGGPTCERCLKSSDDQVTFGSLGWHRVASACVPCSVVPWSAVSLAFLLISLSMVILCCGFSTAVATKLKQLGHYLQLVVLTLNVRVVWPPQLVSILQFITFTQLNSSLFTPECYTSQPINEHYMEWASAMGLPILVIVTAYFLDRKLNSLICEAGREKLCSLWGLRSQLRRGFAVLLFMSYAPLAAASLHTHACSKNMPQSFVFNSSVNIYLYDQDPAKNCESFTFQTFTFVCTLCLGMFILCGPAILAFYTLHLRKWNLMEEKFVLVGFIYDSYTTRFCFWETIYMLRKLITLIMTEVTLLQSCISLGCTLLYTIAVLIARPYRRCSFRKLPSVDVHNIFEVFSNVSLIVLQSCALVSAMSIQPLPVPLVYFALVTVLLVLLVWFLLFVSVKVQDDGIQLLPTKYPEKTSHKDSEFDFWHRNTDGEGVDMLELQQRQNALDF